MPNVKDIQFRIKRYKPGVIDPPRFQTYSLAVTEQMSVLDCLEVIRFEQDPSLMYRHSCHHSSCGTCACIINGMEQLACMTNVWEFETTEVTLEPLNGFTVIGDLTVDMEMLFRDLDAKWSYLCSAESSRADIKRPPMQAFTRFENCIECGSCLSVCPVTPEPESFMGPAALAMIHREMIKDPRKKASMLALANGNRGESLCRRALGCSRVCPTGVYPARHIADIRRAIAEDIKGKNNSR